MHSKSRTRRLGMALSIVAALALLAIPGFASAGKTLKLKTVHSAALKKNVLANTKSRTLYTLSSEKKGKITCTGACLDAWPPLKVKKGTKLTGAKKLGMIKRAEGYWQVTWKGYPLYTFAADKKKGDTTGEGIEGGGGVWHVIASKAKATAKAPAPATPAPSGGYGY